METSDRDRPLSSYVSLALSTVKGLFLRFKPKKTPDRDVAVLLQSLRTILGDQLVSAIVFGSMARDDFHPDYSNVNVLIVAHLPFNTLMQLKPAFKPWLKKGHVPPVLITPHDLPGFARDFPIEFLDMQDSHRVLFGSNSLVGLTVDKRHLYAQCEHDLALAQLRLRQAIAASDNNTSALRHALARSLPSVLTLMHAAVRLDANAPKLDKIKAAERLAALVGHEPLVLQKLKDQHYRRSSDNVKEMAMRYLDLIDAVLKHLRK